MNPPYSEASRWLEKLAGHGMGMALIFARTETEMFGKWVWGRASSVLFISGRLHFHYPDGTRAKGNAGGPSVLVAYGEYDAGILALCGIPGFFTRLGDGCWKAA